MREGNNDQNSCGCERDVGSGAGYSRDGESAGKAKAAQELATAAKTGDEALIDGKFKALGEACKGCHTSFRAPKLKTGEVGKYIFYFLLASMALGMLIQFRIINIPT